jgi:hypothetical protein
MIDPNKLRNEKAYSLKAMRHWIEKLDYCDSRIMRSRWADKVIRGQGYVYVAHMAGTPFYKIGWSKDPDTRHFANVTLPYSMTTVPPITAIHRIETNWTYMLERELHIRFTSQRAGGEWFVLSAVDLLVLRQMKTIDYDLMAELRDRLIEQGWLRIVEAV